MFICRTELYRHQSGARLWAVYVGGIYLVFDFKGSRYICFHGSCDAVEET